jgi:GNAT superfamily N-acetyltransferase
MHIRVFDVRGVSDEECAKINDCMNCLRAETLPDDPPRPAQEQINAWRNLPPMLDASCWAAWDDDRSEVLGYGVVFFLHTEENRHMVQFELYVQPDWRRQGIGRQLLAHLVEVPRREGRRLMFVETNERIPAGTIVMERLGGKAGLSMRVSQLNLPDLDRDLIRTWQARAQERASGFELGVWGGPYPEADLPAIAALHDAMNLAPRGDLDFEDQHMTPEQLRQMEQHLFGRGDERWTMVVRERATGEFAGFTEIMWNPNRPDLAMQGATAVWPKFRNRGLGRWLKAAMIEKVLRDRPTVKRIRTGNAEMNEAMLNINRELGFQPYQSRLIWQVETEQVLAYLAEKNAVAVSTVS